MLPLAVDPLLVDPLLAPAPEVDPLALMADCISVDCIEPDCISPLTTLYSEDDMSMAPSSPHEVGRPLPLTRVFLSPFPLILSSPFHGVDNFFFSVIIVVSLAWSHSVSLSFDTSPRMATPPG